MLKVRLILVWLLLLLLLAGGSYYQLNNYSKDLKISSQDDKVAKNMKLARQDLSLNARKWLEQAESVARTSALTKMLLEAPQLSKQDITILHKNILPLAEKINLQLGSSLFWLVDKKGRVVARLPEKDKFGDGVKGLPVVSSLLNGISTESTLYINSKLMRTIGVPLVDKRQGVVVGGIVAAYNLDKAWLLKLKGNYQTDFVSFSKNAIAHYTGDIAVANAIAKKISQLSLQKDNHGKISRFAFSVGERQFIARATLHNSHLSSLDSGFATYAELPPMYLPIANKHVQMLGVVSIIIFIFGSLLFLLTAFWLKRRAKKVAEAIKITTKGVLVPKLDSTKYPTEFTPFVNLFNDLFSSKDQQTVEATETNPTNLPTAQLSEVPDTFTAEPFVSEASSKASKTKESTAQESTAQEFSSDERIKPKLSKQEKEILKKRMNDSDINNTDNVMDEITNIVSKPKKARKKLKRRNIDKTGTSSAAINVPGASAFASPKKAAANKSIFAPDKSAPDKSEPDESGESDEAEYLLSVFEDFLKLRQTLGQPVNNVKREKFISNLTANSSRIRQKSGCTKVVFTVFEKDGKASVKAAAGK